MKCFCIILNFRLPVGTTLPFSRSVSVTNSWKLWNRIQRKKNFPRVLNAEHNQNMKIVHRLKSIINFCSSLSNVSFLKQLWRKHIKTAFDRHLWISDNDVSWRYCTFTLAIYNRDAQWTRNHLRVVYCRFLLYGTWPQFLIYNECNNWVMQ